MSRSNYSDDCDDNWSWIMWRGRVASAMRGKRGQAFLREMLAALDALPRKRLVADALMLPNGEVCAIGAVAKARDIDCDGIDPEDSETVAATFGIAEAMVREIVYMNDEGWCDDTPEKRWEWMRAWVESLIRKEQP